MFTGRKLALTLAFTVLVALATGISCRGFFTSPTVTAITVGPSGLTLSLSGTQQMVAFGTESDGSPPQNVTSQSLWTSSNPAAASVGENTGKVTAAATIANPPQTTTITAAYQALTGTATISVCPAVTSLTISATPLTVSALNGGTITFTATGVFSGVNGPQNVTDSVSWNITNTTMIPSITDGIGLVTGGAVTAGTTTQVTAILCNVASTNAVTITAQ